MIDEFYYAGFKFVTKKPGYAFDFPTSVKIFAEWPFLLENLYLLNYL